MMEDVLSVAADSQQAPQESFLFTYKTTQGNNARTQVASQLKFTFKMPEQAKRIEPEQEIREPGHFQGDVQKSDLAVFVSELNPTPCDNICCDITMNCAHSTQQNSSVPDLIKKGTEGQLQITLPIRPQCHQIHISDEGIRTSSQGTGLDSRSRLLATSSEYPAHRTDSPDITLADCDSHCSSSSASQSGSLPDGATAPQAGRLPPLSLLSPPSPTALRPAASRRPSLTPIPESFRGHDERSDEDTETDMDRLKALTEKLNLRTRRPSILEWKARQANRQLRQAKPQRKQGHNSAPLTCLCTPPGHCVCHDCPDRKWTPMKKKINAALDWLRTELVSMRQQDQELARLLVSLRRDLHEVKLARLSAQHRELLEDAMEAEEERDDDLHGLTGKILDEPLTDTISPTLKNCGLTRMNISARRFSVF